MSDENNNVEEAATNEDAERRTKNVSVLRERIAVIKDRIAKRKAERTKKSRKANNKKKEYK